MSAIDQEPGGEPVVLHFTPLVMNFDRYLSRPVGEPLEPVLLGSTGAVSGPVQWQLVLYPAGPAPSRFGKSAGAGQLAAAIQVANPQDISNGWRASVGIRVSLVDSQGQDFASQELPAAYEFKPPLKNHGLVTNIMPLADLRERKDELLMQRKHLQLAVDLRITGEAAGLSERLLALDRPKPASSDRAIAICPHCEAPFEVEEGNCNVFRHAVDRKTMLPINPHTPEVECRRLVAEEKVYGCGQPIKLRFDLLESRWLAEKCEYI
jgi:hypothetical protein